MKKTPYVIALVFVATIVSVVLTAHLEPQWWRWTVFAVIELLGTSTLVWLMRRYARESRDA